MIRIILLGVFLLLAVCGGFAESNEGSSKDSADSAVANILFDYDGGSEFASYTVNDSGFVDIRFARDMPDALYAEILTKLQNDKSITGVLSSKTGPICGLF